MACFNSPAVDASAASLCRVACLCQHPKWPDHAFRMPLLGRDKLCAVKLRGIYIGPLSGMPRICFRAGLVHTSKMLEALRTRSAVKFETPTACVRPCLAHSPSPSTKASLHQPFVTKPGQCCMYSPAFWMPSRFRLAL